MKYRKLSKRQLLAMSWWRRPKYQDCEGIICDGSIRSGKTISMSVGFILWAMASFDRCDFAICGKTIESLRRNVIKHLPEWLGGIVDIRERRIENLIIITSGNKENNFYLFGGKDEGSAALIQGITLAGVLFDEVALMPRSFVEQAEGRCSVDGSKYWYNCNPESPKHWFYLERVKKAKEKGLLFLHFTMADNFSLSDRIKKRYENQFVGVFYRRFILGEWCIADGLIYSNFDPAKHTVKPDVIPQQGEHYISIDYGTLNPFSAGLWRVSNGRTYRIAEFYHDGRASNKMLTDEEYYKEIEKLAGGRVIQCIVVDPSAASFIATIRRHGKYQVRKADNSVLDGIRVTAGYLQSGRLLISDVCTAAIREFGLYRWDEKQTSDKPVKESDHAMDEIRYFCMTILRRRVALPKEDA